VKIVFLGNFNVPYSSESQYAATFEKMGHKVIRMQEPNVTTDMVLSTALNADMFFWVHTHGWDLRGHRSMAQVLRKLEAAGVPTVAYHLDLYMGLQRWSEYEQHDYFKVKHFFTVDKLMADWLNENTETKGHYLPAGVFEPECYIGEYDKRFDYDVVFVGSRRYHPEWQYRPQLVDWLKRTYGDRFAHFGNDGMGVVRGRDLNNLYATAKVVVGDTLCKDFTYPYYWSDRIYETTGRGGFIIHPHIDGLDDSFVINEEIIEYKYGDLQQLKDKIDFFLRNEERRVQIQQAGHDRTKRDHTYTNRLQSIINEVKS